MELCQSHHETRGPTASWHLVDVSLPEREQPVSPRRATVAAMASMAEDLPAHATTWDFNKGHLAPLVGGKGGLDGSPSVSRLVPSARRWSWIPNSGAFRKDQ